MDEIKKDIAEIKAILARMEPKINRLTAPFIRTCGLTAERRAALIREWEEFFTITEKHTFWQFPDMYRQQRSRIYPEPMV